MACARLILPLLLLAVAVQSDIRYIIEDMLRSYRKGAQNTDESHFKQKPIHTEYDFIVIGSGPGGSVVANRLSEIAHWDVLLLEAGKEETIFLDIPIFVSYMQFTDYNWNFETEPESNACLGMVDHKCKWPRGKSLGGTSSINYMIYTRGNKVDYDLWAEKGNYGWSWNDVYPYFLKSENIRIPAYKDSPHHSKGGYLSIEEMPYKTKLGRTFMEAGAEMGYEAIDYNNGVPPHGFSYMQEMMKRGHRQSAAKAFLRPIKGRKNINISTKSRVTKILIDPDTKKAYGVEFVKNRRTYVVKARKEIILSAGALQSPQLLMLSGVGPKEHLEELGIPVLKDARVGENLSEHVSYSGLTFLVNTTNVGIMESRLQEPRLMFQWLNRGDGPLTIPGAVEGLGYIKTKLNDDKYGRPDIEFIFASGSLTSDNGGTVRKGLNIRDEVYNKGFKPVDHRDSWGVWPMILRPKSRGCVKLKSKNPWNWPVFYANYFQDEHDLDTIVEGIKAVVAMSQTKAFQKYESYLNKIPTPGCEELEMGSDEYWRCAVRQLTTTLHHQSGTCKMGPASDPGAVVDPELRVYGIHNLRVVDASIIPELPTAHTTAPTYMIGEKASDMIKSTWLGDDAFTEGTMQKPNKCNKCQSNTIERMLDPKDQSSEVVFPPYMYDVNYEVEY